MIFSMYLLFCFVGTRANRFISSSGAAEFSGGFLVFLLRWAVCLWWKQGKPIYCPYFAFLLLLISQPIRSRLDWWRELNQRLEFIERIFSVKFVFVFLENVYHNLWLCTLWFSGLMMLCKNIFWHTSYWMFVIFIFKFN